MPRVCAVCQHDQRFKIDKLLTSGKSMTKIANDFNAPYHSVVYHRDNCLSRQLMKSVEMREASHVENIANDILSVYHRVMSCLEKAERKGKSYLFLEACRELRSYAEFLVRLHQTFVKLQEEEESKADQCEGCEKMVHIDVSKVPDEDLNKLMQSLSKAREIVEVDGDPDGNGKKMVRTRPIPAAPVRDTLH